MEVDLHDELIFTPVEEFSLTAEGGESVGLPLDESNLITKAYQLIKSKTEITTTEYAIHLKKKTPLGGGMGGGSIGA